jgi:hypothetical protein
MCPLHMQSNCSYVFMNQVHERKRDDFARFLLSIALVLAYVQAVGALHGVIAFFFLLVLETLKPAAWIPLLPLAYTVWITSSNLLFPFGWVS